MLAGFATTLTRLAEAGLEPALLEALTVQV